MNIQNKEKIWKLEESKNNTLNSNIIDEYIDNNNGYEILELNDIDNESLNEPLINE